MTDSSDMIITHKAILDRAKQDALEYMPDLPKVGDSTLMTPFDVAEWESFIDDLESLDAFEIAHESAEWDWVIYTHRAMELCQAVPNAVLHEAESEWLDLYGGSTIDDSFGLYEMACQLANLIVIRAIAEAVEECREELLELANDKLEQMESI